VQAIQSGILFGYVGLVEGMVARFRQELGPEMKVIATGGLAEIIAQEETDVIQFVDLCFSRGSGFFREIGRHCPS
jgi:type III pantothenate kinase